MTSKYILWGLITQSFFKKEEKIKLFKYLKCICQYKIHIYLTNYYNIDVTM